MAAHEYWRLYIVSWQHVIPGAAGAGGTRGNIDNIVFKDGNGDVIPTSGGTVIYSNQFITGSGSGYAVNAFNASASYATAQPWFANWSGNAPEWIGYYFTEAIEPASLEITMYGGGLYGAWPPKSLIVQYSDDGTTWENYAAFSNIDWGFNPYYHYYNEEMGWVWTLANPLPTKVLVMADGEQVNVTANYVEVIETTHNAVLNTAILFVEVISSVTSTDLPAARPPKRLCTIIG